MTGLWVGVAVIQVQLILVCYLMYRELHKLVAFLEKGNRIAQSARMDSTNNHMRTRETLTVILEEVRNKNGTSDIQD